MSLFRCLSKYVFFHAPRSDLQSITQTHIPFPWTISTTLIDSLTHSSSWSSTRLETLKPRLMLCHLSPLLNPYPQVENVVVWVDCVISDYDSSSASSSSNKFCGPFSNLFHLFFGGIVAPSSSWPIPCPEKGFVFDFFWFRFGFRFSRDWDWRWWRDWSS